MRMAAITTVQTAAAVLDSLYAEACNDAAGMTGRAEPASLDRAWQQADMLFNYRKRILGIVEEMAEAL